MAMFTCIVWMRLEDFAIRQVSDWRGERKEGFSGYTVWQENHFENLILAFHSPPFTDAIIGQVAINNDVSVLTSDHHFKLIQSVIPELKLYE